jgi:hypothetical protein
MCGDGDGGLERRRYRLSAYNACLAGPGLIVVARDAGGDANAPV